MFCYASCFLLQIKIDFPEPPVWSIPACHLQLHDRNSTMFWLKYLGQLCYLSVFSALASIPGPANSKSLFPEVMPFVFQHELHFSAVRMIILLLKLYKNSICVSFKHITRCHLNWETNSCDILFHGFLFHLKSLFWYKTLPPALRWWLNTAVAPSLPVFKRHQCINQNDLEKFLLHRWYFRAIFCNETFKQRTF